jgi:hypothetical protein
MHLRDRGNSGQKQDARSGARIRISLRGEFQDAARRKIRQVR